MIEHLEKIGEINALELNQITGTTKVIDMNYKDRVWFLFYNENLGYFSSDFNFYFNNFNILNFDYPQEVFVLDRDSIIFIHSKLNQELK